MLSAVLPPEASRALHELRLEYLDATGRLRSERDLRLASQTERYEGGARVLETRFVDPETGISLTRGYRVTDTDEVVVERTGALRNQGNAPLTLRRFDWLHLDFDAPPGGWLAQTASPDYGFAHNTVTPGRPLTIEAPGAGESLQQVPGIVLAQAGGGGLFVGVGWSAGFILEASAPDAAHGRLRVSEAVDGLVLAPGRTLDAPPVFLGAYAGGMEDGAQALRRAVLALRPVSRMGAPPVTWNSWFAYDRQVDEATLRAEAEAAAALGVEVFYVDHGWQRMSGDWRAHPDRFTSGSLRALSDHVHALGMKFGVWMAFGITDPRAPVAAQHPDWLADPLASDVTQPIDGARLLCLALAEEWVVAEVDRVVREYGVDWLKIDQAMIGECASQGDSRGASLRENAQSLYHVLDRLRARHPALVIENCFNGGGYLDYGMYERTDVAWLTDSAGWYGYRPYELQAALAGATRAMPASYLTLWLTEAHVRDAAPLEYWGMSTLGGAWGLSMRLTELSAEDRREVRRLVRFYKHLRDYVTGGELAYVREPVADGWHALEYARPGGNGAALLAVRNGGSGAESLKLTGLEADAMYRIRCEGWACAALDLPRAMRGQRLMRAGLSLDLKPQQGVLLYFEKR